MSEREEICEVCLDPTCQGPAVHQIAATLGAYRLSHQRGEHHRQSVSLCPLCWTGEVVRG